MIRREWVSRNYINYDRMMLHIYTIVRLLNIHVHDSTNFEIVYHSIVNMPDKLNWIFNGNPLLL
jgi:hypothetical protein